VSRGSGPESSPADQFRALVPAFAFAAAALAVITDPASTGDAILAGCAAGAFAAWAYLPNVPLPLLAATVLIPVVAVQRSGAMEPVLFDASLLAFVVGRWAPSRPAAVALGLLALASPAAASLIQSPAEIAVGIWIIGIVFPWLMGRAMARQRQLALELDGAQRQLADQALLAERRRIARDVHDSVGHGVAAVMLQVTSARHVLRRDPTAAEEALRSAEEVGRRSMQELRRTVGLLRSDNDTAAASVRDIPALVDHARAGGLAVELRTRGDLDAIAPSVGVALYRVAQEALANAARHAPRARTVLEIDIAAGQASLLADTTGPTLAASAGEAKRPRYGLVGMRERAIGLGGELEAGPTREGWRVRCRLPVEATDAASIGEAGGR
jgi:signal transduction histidine kinase